MPIRIGAPLALGLAAALVCAATGKLRQAAMASSQVVQRRRKGDVKTWFMRFSVRVAGGWPARFQGLAKRLLCLSTDQARSQDSLGWRSVIHN
jgi:hypothetical protein